MFTQEVLFLVAHRPLPLSLAAHLAFGPFLWDFFSHRMDGFSLSPMSEFKVNTEVKVELPDEMYGEEIDLSHSPDVLVRALEAQVNDDISVCSSAKPEPLSPSATPITQIKAAPLSPSVIPSDQLATDSPPPTNGPALHPAHLNVHVKMEQGDVTESIKKHLDDPVSLDKRNCPPAITDPSPPCTVSETADQDAIASPTLESTAASPPDTDSTDTEEQLMHPFDDRQHYNPLDASSRLIAINFEHVAASITETWLIPATGHIRDLHQEFRRLRNASMSFTYMGRS